MRNESFIKFPLLPKLLLAFLCANALTAHADSKSIAFSDFSLLAITERDARDEAPLLHARDRRRAILAENPDALVRSSGGLVRLSETPENDFASPPFFTEFAPKASTPGPRASSAFEANGGRSPLMPAPTGFDPKNRRAALRAFSETTRGSLERERLPEAIGFSEDGLELGSGAESRKERAAPFPRTDAATARERRQAIRQLIPSTPIRAKKEMPDPTRP